MKRYSDELKKPLEPIHGFGAVQSKERDARLQEKLTKTFCEKFLLLFQHFGIAPDTPDAWVRLSFALAQKHVRGFQEIRKPGVKRKWTIFERFKLKKEVDELLKGAGNSSNKGIFWACGELASKEPWKSLLAKNKEPLEALRHQYYMACQDIKDAEQHSGR